MATALDKEGSYIFVSDGYNTYSSTQIFTDNQPGGAMADRMWEAMRYDNARIQRDQQEQSAADQSAFVSSVVAELDSTLDLSGRISTMEMNLETSLEWMTNEVEFYGGTVDALLEFVNQLDLVIPDDAVGDPNPPTHRYLKRPI